jgi:hypothetical protein
VTPASIRRDIIRSATLATLFACMAATAQIFPDIKPAPQQTQWQDLEFGVIPHFGTNTFLNREWGDGTASPKIFNPKQSDPEQWMTAIQASGARYVVLVAKHHYNGNSLPVLVVDAAGLGACPADVAVLKEGGIGEDHGVGLIGAQGLDDLWEVALERGFVVGVPEPVELAERSVYLDGPPAQIAVAVDDRRFGLRCRRHRARTRRGP